MRADAQGRWARTNEYTAYIFIHSLRERKGNGYDQESLRDGIRAFGLNVCDATERLQVGWYGGVDYGYYGSGYVGGRWRGNTFAYNTAVSNVDPARVRIVYRDPGAVNHNWNRISYHGGRNGIQAQPAAGQLAAARARRLGPSSAQMRQAQIASTDRGNFARVNRGRPASAALASSLQREPVWCCEPACLHEPVGRPATVRSRPSGAAADDRAAQHYAAPQMRAAPAARPAAPVARAAPQRPDNNRR
jgi:hypothetical protein